jgi:hypothetical protein
MTALRDNRAELIATSVAGRVAPARIHAEAMASDHDGRIRLLPGTGGIALGVHAGDRAADWMAEHLMTGASIEDADGTPAMAGPLHLLSCIGNRVRDAAGRGIGVVAGKRGGLAPGFWAPQLVGVEISDAVAARLNPEDRIIVETIGRGLKLIDHPDITLANLSPSLLDALPLNEAGGALACEVCAIIPPEAAGAGLGQDSWVGDLEITDERCLAGSLGDLRFGDLVAFADIDSHVSRFYSPGMVSIGIVSHGPSHAPGHGIGITILLTGPAEGLIASMGRGGMGPTLRTWSEGLAE